MNSNLTLKNKISNLLLINNTISKSRIKNNSKFPKTNKLSVKQLFKNKSCKAKQKYNQRFNPQMRVLIWSSQK